ncbi:MAG: HAD family hydrolase [Thermoanaerobaculia bacterium]
MSGRQQFESLLFDLGGVLMDFAAFEELAKLLPEPLGPSAMRAKWLGSGSVREFELGELAPEEFARRFVDEWALPQTPGGFLSEFRAWLRGFYPGIPQLLDQLRPRYRLACLSNTNRVHWAIFESEVRGHLDEALVSFELGMAKPDPAIFHAALDRLGVEAGEVALFDDSEANVEAAQQAGLRAELVRGPDELREALERCGVLGADSSLRLRRAARAGTSQAVKESKC